jgi:NADH-quinone oxidoreductase subunit J
MSGPMEAAFYVAAAVAVVSTLLAISRLVAVHALLYLIVSFLSVAVVFYTMGAPLVATLEVIIYAGAILVLFLFVVMMLNLGTRDRDQERQWFSGAAWLGPAILSAILLAEVIYLIVSGATTGGLSATVGPKEVALALYGPYMIGVELASMLLLGAVVGATHLSKQEARP